MKSDQPTSHRPLTGITVLDMSRDIAGSYAASLLSEAGAIVTKVVAPEGIPPEREATWTGNPPSYGILWRYANRGKHLWHVDQISAKDRARLDEALATADVVVHDLTDEEAAAERRSADVLHEINPQLVIMTVTAFGAFGPKASHSADDLVSIASSGVMHSTPGFPDFVMDPESDPPLRPSSEIVGLATGVVAAAGCVEGLLARGRTGSGQKLDVSAQEAIASLLAWDYGIWNYGQTDIGRRQSTAGLAPNSYLPCKDGWVVLVAFAEHHWKQLVEMMGNPDWANSELFATMVDRGRNWDSLEPLIRLWLDEQPRTELMREAQRRGLPTCAALEIPEAFDNEQTRARAFYRELDGGQVPGPVPIVNGTRVPSVSEASTISEYSKPDRRRALPAVGLQTDLGGSLEGVRVVDFGHIVAVPLAASWLGFMGAEVIQIESRTNLASRRFVPIIGDPPENTSGMYNHVNRNKKSVTLNLRHPRGPELARRLVQTADVVMENYSTGTMEKLGLGYQDLKHAKPDVIMVSLSAFGHDGPWRDYAALHSGVMLLSGLAAVTGYEGGHPRMCGSILPDGLAACRVVLTTLQAIYHKWNTGEGQHVRLAMSEVMQALLPEPIYEYTRYGVARPRLGNRHPSHAPHGVYRTSGEDGWIALSVRCNDEFAAFADAIGREDLLSDPRFATTSNRLSNRQVLDDLIAGWAANVDAKAAADSLQRRGVRAGPVLGVKDLLADEHLQERGFVRPVTHPIAGTHSMPGKPWKLASPADPEIFHAPLLGGWNDEFYREFLGFTQDEIDQLIEDQLIF